MTTLAYRLTALLHHLGISQVFIATQMPGDIAEFCLTQHNSVRGVSLVIPSRINPAAFAPLGKRVMVLAGSSGIPTDTANTAAPKMSDSWQVRLSNYDASAWSDIALEQPEALCKEIIDFFCKVPTIPAPEITVKEGTIEGISYRVIGAGPALILTPFFLAASQWEPVLDTLAQRFTVIVLGGSHIGGVAMLEDRASLPSYMEIFSNLLKRMRFSPKSQILEVGCGSAALCCQALATYPQAALTGLDSNNYLLREGATLARAKGLQVSGPNMSIGAPSSGGLSLTIGNAIHLPFADDSFDAVYSITVLEECDADKALSEMARVVRPGGAVGVVVRAIDMPQWWNLDLPPTITAKVNSQPQSIAPGAVADRSLYARMAKAGFREIQGYPALLTFDRPDGPIWAYRASHARGLLNDKERAIWDREVALQWEAGLLFQANPVHCALAKL